MIIRRFASIITLNYLVDKKSDTSYWHYQYIVRIENQSTTWGDFAPCGGLLYFQNKKPIQKASGHIMAEALKMKVDTIGGKILERYNLPDARDGLTPRQRRILWVMYLRKLSSKSKFEKTACTFSDAGGTYGVDGEMSDHWGFGEADIINDTIAQMTPGT